VRRFDVDDDVELPIVERHPLGVAVHKTKASKSMHPAAEHHRRVGQVHADHRRRPEIPRDVRGAAAPPTADLQHLQSRQVDQCGDVVIELDLQSVRLVDRLERRLRLVGGADIAQIHER
jgi:hypothetical protein